MPPECISYKVFVRKKFFYFFLSDPEWEEIKMYMSVTWKRKAEERWFVVVSSAPAHPRKPPSLSSARCWAKCPPAGHKTQETCRKERENSLGLTGHPAQHTHFQGVFICSFKTCHFLFKNLNPHCLGKSGYCTVYESIFKSVIPRHGRVMEISFLLSSSENFYLAEIAMKNVKHQYCNQVYWP